MGKKRNKRRSNDVRNLPEDWWKHKDAARILSHWFVNHTVALHVNYTVDGRLYGQTYTGFLLYYRKKCIWVTAGHVIEATDNLMKCGSCKILGWKWLDNYEIGVAGAIPVDYENLPKCGINNREVDLGVVGFGLLDLKAINANEKKDWLTSEIWKNNHLAKPDGYYLVGYPEEAVDLTSTQTATSIDCTVDLTLMCVPVERIQAQKPVYAGDFWDHPDWFYGKLVPVTRQNGQYLSSIKGMSGGPILSLERTSEGNIKYRLFAIQSGWLPDSKVLCGTPIGQVVELIDEGFDAAERESSQL